MGTRERHIGHTAARSAPVADPRGGRLFAMPRFLVGITHLVYRRRAFVIAGVITALFLLLLAVLPALFASDPKLSNTVPVYGEVSKEVVDGLIHSSSIPLLVAAIAFSIWGVLVYLRCLDYVLRRRLVAVATICALWMIEVILKYKSFTPFYATILWYLYYVPMTLVPLLYQLCGLRLAGLEQHRAGRRYRTALWVAAILLIGFVLTNDFHQQVFHFDRSSDTWSNDYTYGWGYFAKQELFHRNFRVVIGDVLKRLVVGERLCRMWACRLLRDSNSDLGVAGAGALGMRLHGKGEHEAVTGLRVGGYGEGGVRGAFLPQ